MIKPMESSFFEAAYAIVAGLVLGIVALWKTNHATMSQRIAHAERKLAECESQHKEATDQLIELSERVGNLEAHYQMQKGSK